MFYLGQLEIFFSFLFRSYSNKNMQKSHKIQEKILCSVEFSQSQLLFLSFLTSSCRESSEPASCSHAKKTWRRDTRIFHKCFLRKNVYFKGMDVLLKKTNILLNKWSRVIDFFIVFLTNNITFKIKILIFLLIFHFVLMQIKLIFTPIRLVSHDRKFKWKRYYQITLI